MNIMWQRIGFFFLGMAAAPAVKAALRTMGYDLALPHGDHKSHLDRIREELRQDLADFKAELSAELKKG